MNDIIETKKPVHNRLNLTGQRFGRLVVLNHSGTNKNNKSMWECECDCGTIKEIMGTYLINGDTNSCGCLQKDLLSQMGFNRRLEKGLGGFKSLMSDYKRCAKKRGYEFNLTIEQFSALTSSTCYYCRIKPFRFYYPASRTKELKEWGKYLYNGIDRVDNTIGYLIDNCVPCCRFCNQAKNNMSVDEFDEWIERIYDHRIKTNK